MKLSHDHDVVEERGWVELPGGLKAKYLAAARSWPWQWAFPARQTYRDLATEREQRHHLHESVIQRGMAEAVRATGIGKRGSCHTLRHSFATHLAESPGRGDDDGVHARAEPGAPGFGVRRTAWG